MNRLTVLKLLVNECGQELLYGLYNLLFSKQGDLLCLLKTLVHGFGQELFHLLESICKLQIR